jgi:5-methylcytosine-specific restriction endonuclease McrA
MVMQMKKQEARWDEMSYEQLLARMQKKRDKMKLLGKEATFSHRFRVYMQVRFARLKGRCEECGATENLTADHIIPISMLYGFGYDSFHDFREEWLQCLCRPCNYKKSNLVNWKDPRAVKILQDIIKERTANEIRKSFSFRSSVVVPLRLFLFQMWEK